MQLTEYDWRRLMERLDSFEEKLKSLEKDISKLKAEIPNTSYCLSQGSLMDSGSPQEWRENLNSDQDSEE